MIRGLYAPRDSALHRMAPAGKLLAIPLVGTALFLTGSLPVIAAASLLILALFPLARLSGRIAWAQLRPVLPVLALIFLAQLWIADWQAGLVQILRLSALILLAALVTLTTRTADLVETIVRSLTPLRRLGLDPAKIGLAISLSLRFIPVVAGILDEVREAQAARGLEKNAFALAVPMLVRTLKMTDEIAEAIEARS